MKKRIITLASVFLGATLSFSSILKFENINRHNIAAIDKALFTSSSDNTNSIQASQSTELFTAQQAVLNAQGNAESSINEQGNTQATRKVAENSSTSRGGVPPQDKLAEAKENAKSSKADVPESKVELLDWWKEARYIFSKGSNAEVTDLYTGKTFNVKRTMGTNHADTEALTKEDTAVIKSIWGGFSWDRRPVIVKINGRRLSASMSAMPHAGLDSAPAYTIINNRSDGYGRGENLDVIKGNKMDGHFDIHFLNSTRHKDGRKDPEHQAAIMKAAGK